MANGTPDRERASADGGHLTVRPPAQPMPSDTEMKRLRRAEQLPLTGSWVADHRTRRVAWSRSMYAIFGVAPEAFEPTFENALAALLPEDQRHLRQQARYWMSQDGAFGGVYRLLRPDGMVRLLELRGWAEVEADGRINRSMGTGRDVTEEHAVAREHERLSRQRAAILAASAEGMCGVDAGGRVTFANPALRRMMRREGERLEGHTLHELVHVAPDGSESHPAERCPYAVAGRHAIDAADREFRRADGTTIETAYTLQPVADDEEPSVLVSLRDVTPRRAAARLLQTSLRRVQMLTSQRTALLDNLAETQERERLRIAADIHDDTVQALGAVGLRLEHAAERAAGDPAEELLHDAGLVVRDVAEQLRRVMYELLPPEMGDDLAASVRCYCRVLLADQQMDAEVVGSVTGLPADRELLAYRLVQEAIRNAVKHSGGTRVRVELASTDDELHARVADDGVGIDPADHAGATHAGLRILRRRAETVGGSATFTDGLDGRGVAIELRLPTQGSER